MQNDSAHPSRTGDQDDTAAAAGWCARLAAAMGLLLLPLLLPAPLRPGAAPYGAPSCAVPSCATGAEVYVALTVSVVLGIWALCAPVGRTSPPVRVLCACGQAWTLFFVLSVAG
ncbi:hypothetical protein [Streptomyces bohaiensis]|uniref:Uncharacterized protein n=1 Tax=Streptomyces bohaiensis TaxID=1431344 RepID=A0ABX1CBH4_9ACTN|nr:hypothetical protein [Streptomyces bohaiensis]NJQ16463.1 hypothetical protein [Streptomyces bohaiensis]